MTATLLTKISIALITFLLMIPIKRKQLFAYKGILALFFIAYLADNLIIVLTNQYRGLQLIPNHIWQGFLVCGWSGKLYSIVFTLAWIYLTRQIITASDIGLTLHQKERSVLPASLVVLALAVWATIIGITSPKGVFDASTLVYLAIMPALNEELVYRGYLLGILNKVMPRKINFLGAEIGWGVILSSILFSLLHGFWFDSDFSIHVDLIALENSFFSGFIFAWLRERTGSLVMPMIAHGLEDFLFFLPRMV
jgi:membrane protease YdiL (CAAX protease family)